MNDIYLINTWNNNLKVDAQKLVMGHVSWEEDRTLKCSTFL